jgi:ABC-2 type transport system ATP-binding protein
MVLEARHLTRDLGGARVIDDVSFSCRRGEIVGLIGPNGAGKTTLLETLAGFIAGEVGEVVVDGHALPFHARSSKLFYVPDIAAPFPNESVAEIIGFFARGRAFNDVVEELALTPVLSARADTLSKGFRRRLLVAIALLSAQPFVLLDEPFDGLDLTQTRELMRVLRSWLNPERGLLLSIHQLTDAERICDRFVLLSGGRVRGDGTLAELRGDNAQATLEEVFIALS